LEEREGLLVRGVADDSPAAASGLRRGDLIVAVAGREVASADDLFEALDRAGPGGTLQLAVVRGDEERSVSVSLTGRSAAAEEA
jgi:S1-C subfamily serine protease